MPPTKNKNELAALFGVDADYIMCKQPERIKHKSDAPKEKDDIQELNEDMTDAFIRFLNVKGYDIFPSSYTCENVDYTYMRSKQSKKKKAPEDKTFEEVRASDEISTGISEYEVYYPDGITKVVSAKDMDSFINSITDFIEYQLQKLRDNSRPSRPDIIKTKQERSEHDFKVEKSTGENGQLVVTVSGEPVQEHDSVTRRNQRNQQTGREREERTWNETLKKYSKKD